MIIYVICWLDALNSIWRVSTVVPSVLSIVRKIYVNAVELTVMMVNY